MSHPVALALSPPRAAYLHIPFCRRRCFYCDFPISVVGEFKTFRDRPDQPPEPATGRNSTQIIEYLAALEREITLGADRAAADQPPLETVFFGGGTPSLLAPEQVDRLLQLLDRRFGLAPQVEISMELDPGTFDRTWLAGFLAAGVNRISLGVQAFQAELLTACGRSHGVQDIEQAVALLQSAGVKNWSLDLISGLPNQSIDQWQASLDRAVACGPAHLSVYDLIIEPQTVFDRRYQPGDRPLPSDEQTAQMYRMASQTLQAVGFQHYEVSNYARSGFQCRHNRTYWENRPYYGFGMGATSYVAGQRFGRPRTRAAYYDWLNHGAIEPPASPQSAPDRLAETLMLGLRLAEGLALEPLRREFGPVWIDRVLQCLDRFVAEGWVVRSGDRLALAEPDGLLFSNSILAEIFSTLEQEPFQ
ncbi:MAG: radical SAM family heme chaperone HemW [Limnothrix sp. BL-A-16]